MPFCRELKVTMNTISVIVKQRKKRLTFNLAYIVERTMSHQFSMTSSSVVESAISGHVLIELTYILFLSFENVFFWFRLISPQYEIQPAIVA